MSMACFWSALLTAIMIPSPVAITTRSSSRSARSVPGVRLPQPGDDAAHQDHVTEEMDTHPLIWPED
jgi:hypothetical protein